MQNQPLIILFDGICNLCNGFVQFIIRRDPAGKFRFASLQSEAGQAQLAKFNLSKDAFTSLVLIQGDCYYIKSEAVLRAAREIGGGVKLFYGFMIIPEGIRDFIYDRIARSRYRLFCKRKACMIPTPELQGRFL